jgi:hypothetical protein
MQDQWEGMPARFLEPQSFLCCLRTAYMGIAGRALKIRTIVGFHTEQAAS